MALFLTQNLFVASGIDYLIYLTRPSHHCCNRTPSWAGSLGRYGGSATLYEKHNHHRSYGSYHFDGRLQQKVVE